MNGSRTVGTVYTNSSDNPLVVSIMIPPDFNDNVTASFYIDGVLIDSYGIGANKAEFNGIIPPGSTYEVTSDYASPDRWIEYQI